MRKSLIAALATTALLSGCFSRIETGSVGVIRHFTGEISPTAAYGWNWMILDSMLANVDTTETRIPISNLRPADSNGVLLDNLEIIVSFKLNPELVPAFYIQTKELDEYVDDTNHHVTTVGLKVLENVAKHAVQELTKKQSLVTLAANLTSYELAIMAQAQLELDKGYPGVFKLIRVNVNHFVPPGAILDQANKTAALKSEVERNVEEQKLIAQRTVLETSKAEIEAVALKAAMDKTHLSAADLIAWKNARAYEVQARAIGETAIRTVNAAAQPATAK
jgi:hypothetical protein